MSDDEKPNSSGMPTNPTSSHSAGKDEEVSYCQLLCGNRNYRWYIISYLITHFGEWLTYIASIDFIEKVQAEHQQETSRTAISVLILVRLLPNVVLSTLGGALADSQDRRNLMIFLDLCGALCAALFVFSFTMESIPLLYLATACQQCVAGLYAPSHSAIVPMLVKSDGELKKATTMEGLTWSAMQAFGAAASGWMVDAVGITNCFVIDGISYVISATFLLFVQGNFRVSHDNQSSSESARSDSNFLSTWRYFIKMLWEGIDYLRTSLFGALVFFKGTAALGYGACDILNVAFSEETTSSISPNRKLGILFSLVGIGCLLGPIAAEPFVHVERPRSLQVSCIVAFFLSIVGYFGWGFFPEFWTICLFAVIRAAGSSNVWIHSTLLLQKFSASNMLGRVLAADYAIALVAEALAAYVCGAFMDHHTDWSPSDVSMVLAWLTSLIAIGWVLYHWSGRGACRYSGIQPEGDSKMILAETIDLLEARTGEREHQASLVELVQS